MNKTNCTVNNPFSRKTKIFQGKRKFNLHFFINYKINNIKYKQSINSVI